jgi:hypothetical protein
MSFFCERTRQTLRAGSFPMIPVPINRGLYLYPMESPKGGSPKAKFHRVNL